MIGLSLIILAAVAVPVIFVIRKKYRIAGAICFLVPTILAVTLGPFIHYGSFWHCFPPYSETLLLYTLFNTPCFLFGIFILVKAKNTLFIIPSALNLVIYIVSFLPVVSWMLRLCASSTPINTGVSNIFGDHPITSLTSVVISIMLIVACLTAKKVKFLAYLPFGIYATISLLSVVLTTARDYTFVVVLPVSVVFSMAFFCLAKHLTSEKVAVKAVAEQQPQVNNNYTNSGNNYKNTGNNYKNTGNNYKSNNQVKDLVDRNSEIELPVNSKPDAITEELTKYKELLEKGLIDEEEFKAKKKQILGI